MEIMRAIEAATKPDDIPREKRDLYLSRFKEWMSSQVGFAEGRKRRFFEKELAGLDSVSFTAVGDVFNNFDESIRRAKRNADEVASYDFQRMARLLVPDAFESKA
jgi:hypothetical protein